MFGKKSKADANRPVVTGPCAAAAVSAVKREYHLLYVCSGNIEMVNTMTTAGWRIEAVSDTAFDPFGMLVLLCRTSLEGGE